MSLQLRPGSLGGQAALQAARLGLRQGGAGDADIVVVDVPDVSAAGDWAPPDRLVVFDDRDAFTTRAAIVIQPSLPAWSGRGSADRLLAGYAYAPIAQRFRELRETDPGARDDARPGGLRQVLVCLGASDPFAVTERLGQALADGVGWTAVAVVGPFHRSTQPIPIPVVRDPPDLAERLAGCDLALLAGGTMKFEAACLGRPSLLVAAADDQLAVGPAFAATGAAVWLGDGRAVDPRIVRGAVDELIADDGRRRTMTRTALTVIDGRGADRLAEAIIELGDDRTGRER